MVRAPVKSNKLFVKRLRVRGHGLSLVSQFALLLNNHNLLDSCVHLWFSNHDAPIRVVCLYLPEAIAAQRCIME